MVIQRLQSLYLLIASIMMGFFCFRPMALISEAPVCVCDYPVYLTLNALIALLLLISIFMFKNLARQQMVVKICLFLYLASGVSGALLIYNLADVAIAWFGAPLLLGAAFVITLAALARIKADDKLLKSYDRLR